MLDRFLQSEGMHAEPGVNSRTFYVTLAEVNAGKTLVKGHGAVAYRVSGVLVKAIGTWAALTDVRIGSTASTPVVAVTLAQSALNDATLDETDSGVTLGAGFWGTMGPGDGIKIYKTGSTGTGGVRLELKLEWHVVSGASIAGETTTSTTTTTTTSTTTTTTTTTST